MNGSMNYCTESDWSGLHEAFGKAIKKRNKSSIMGKQQRTINQQQPHNQLVAKKSTNIMPLDLENPDRPIRVGVILMTG